MNYPMQALEVTGTIDENRRLQLDKPLPVSGPAHVRVIILYPLADDITEEDWLKAAASNPAFSDLYDPQEDIYTLADGKPFYTTDEV